MPRRYATHLEITTHAHGRWRLRAPGQIELSGGMIMARLNNLLRMGVQPDRDGGVWVPVTKRLSAICMPQTGICGGGWALVTYKYHGVWARFNLREVAE